MSTADQTDLIAAGMEDSRILAKEFAELAHAHFGDRVGRIVLYGSTARGDWSQESDIDVLVTLDEVSDSDGEWLVSRAFSLGVMGSGIVLQPVFMTEARFTEMRNRELRFAMDIISEGIPL